MARLNKDDLRQMNRGYFQSLSKETLVEVANNLHIERSGAVGENQFQFEQ